MGARCASRCCCVDDTEWAPARARSSGMRLAPGLVCLLSRRPPGAERPRAQPDLPATAASPPSATETPAAAGRHVFEGTIAGRPVLLRVFAMSTTAAPAATCTKRSASCCGCRATDAASRSRSAWPVTAPRAGTSHSRTRPTPTRGRAQGRRRAPGAHDPSCCDAFDQKSRERSNATFRITSTINVM